MPAAVFYRVSARALGFWPKMGGVKVTFCHFCDYANICADGAVNIMGVRNAVTFSTLPILFPDFSIVLGLVSEPDDVGATRVVEVRLIDPDGKPLLGGRFEFITQLPNQRVAQRMSFMNQKLEKAGRHELNTYVDGKLVLSDVLEVLVAPAPPSTGPMG